MSSPAADTSGEEFYDESDGCGAEEGEGRRPSRVDGRKYNVVPDKAGGVTLEPAITVFADELHERHGTRSLTDAEFDELFGQLPSDGEG